MGSNLQVFISSSMEELAEERQAAYALIEASKFFNPFVFEKSLATSTKARELFKAKVRECDIFILIIGQKLGEYTLDEFNLAQHLRKPTLVFVRDVEKRSPDCDLFVKERIYSVDSPTPHNYRTVDEFEQNLELSLHHTITERFRKNMKDIEETPLAVKKILTKMDSTRFIELGRHSVKSPLELIKEAPRTDNVLPVMTGLTNIPQIPRQIEFVKNMKYAEIYANSWAEEDAMLIGYKALREIGPLLPTGKFTDLYDAGCANCGQYSAFEVIHHLLPDQVDEDFVYYAQDYNSDWEERFRRRGIPNSHFFPSILPEVPVGRNSREFTLVGCAHVLHYMHMNPLGIYTTLFSFNLLLKKGGICYITVPLKDSQPGMLDILEKAAQDAAFTIIMSGKRQVVRGDTPEPFNILSYVYLILAKDAPINREKYHELLRCSLSLAGCDDDRDEDDGYGHGSIPQRIRDLERDLSLILRERDSRVLTLRKAIVFAERVWRMQRSFPSRDECIDRIRGKIGEINRVLIEPRCLRSRGPLAHECEEYLFWLVSFLLRRYTSHEHGSDIMTYITLTTDIIKSAESPRISLENYQEKDNAYLLKHLFDLCRDNQIDLDEKIARTKFLDIPLALAGNGSNPTTRQRSQQID